MKRITIIVPIYNVENYLEDCLNSILNQTYSNLDVILVDDSSHDNSLKIARLYADKYNFRLIEKTENEGLSEARNSALKIMNGDFVMFLDSDDILHPKTCEILLNIEKEKNSDIISFRNFRFKDEYTFAPLDKVEYEDVTPLEELKYGVMACARLYRANLFENFFFPAGMLAEDVATVPILLCKAKVLTTINSEIYGYRLPRLSSLTSNGERLMEDSPKAIRMLLANDSVVNRDIIEYITIKMFVTLIRRFIISTPIWKNNLDEFIENNSDLSSILDMPTVVKVNNVYPLTKKDKKYAKYLIKYMNSGFVFFLLPFIISRIGKIIRK